MVITFKPASPHVLQSDLARVDAHEITVGEYDELPELTDEMFADGKVTKGRGASDAIQRISLELPIFVVDRWKSTGPDWQARMAEYLGKLP